MLIAILESIGAITVTYSATGYMHIHVASWFVIVAPLVIVGIGACMLKAIEKIAGWVTSLICSLF